MGQLSVWAMTRQGSDLHVDCRTMAGLGAALRRAGVSLFCSDVYQGTRIQGVFSKTGVDFESVADVAACAKRFLTDHGVRWAPMVNPFGADPEGEATPHAGRRAVRDAAGECPFLAADLEVDYDGFWRLPYWDATTGPAKPAPVFPPEQTAERLARYFGALARALDGIPIAVVPDPRQIGCEDRPSFKPTGRSSRSRGRTPTGSTCRRRATGSTRSSR